MFLCRALFLFCELIFFGILITIPVIADDSLPSVCHTLPDTFHIMLPDGWVTYPMQGYDGLTGIIDPDRSNITYMIKIMDNPTGTILDAPLLRVYLDAIAFRDGIEIVTDSVLISGDDSLYAIGIRNATYASIYLGSTPTNSYELYGYYDDLTALQEDKPTFLKIAENIDQNQN